MAQSPGDHNSRGFKSTKNYTKIFSLGKLSRLEHLRLGGLSLAVAFAFSGRYSISGNGGSGGWQRGHDLTQLWFSIFLQTISQRLLCSLAPAKKEDVPLRRPLYSAPSHVMPGTWRLPIGSFGLALARGSSSRAHLTQAPEPRANP